jgi:hypothetical protein
MVEYMLIRSHMEYNIAMKMNYNQGQKSIKHMLNERSQMLKSLIIAWFYLYKFQQQVS